MGSIINRSGLNRFGVATDSILYQSSFNRSCCIPFGFENVSSQIKFGSGTSQSGLPRLTVKCRLLKSVSIQIDLSIFGYHSIQVQISPVICDPVW